MWNLYSKPYGAKSGPKRLLIKIKPATEKTKSETKKIRLKSEKTRYKHENIKSATEKK